MMVRGILMAVMMTVVSTPAVFAQQQLTEEQKEVVSGDLLLINNNNYHTYGAELFNGDIAKVISVDTEIVTQSAPVFCDIDGKKVRRIITLKFRKITIKERK